MNEDSKGLLKYFSILTFTILFSPGIFVVSEPFFKAAGIYNNDTAIEIFIGSILIGLFMGFFIPVIITIRAICTGWSKYLDWFFNRFIIPTIVLIGLLALVSSTKLIGPIFDLATRVALILVESLLWAYFGIYLVIIINNIIRLFKKFKKK